MKYFKFKFLMVLLTLAMAIPPAWADMTDVITSSDLTATTTTPSNFSGVTKSGVAVYAGKTGKHLTRAAIRFRTGSSTDICTTTSGGVVKSVTIVFNDATTTNRTVEVYGKNTAYSAGDVYDNSTKGTLIGSAKYSGGETQVVTATGDAYRYIAIRTLSGSADSYELFMDRIEIVWGTPGLETSTGALTINDSGSGNTFTITGTNLIDNVGVGQNPVNNDFTLNLSGSGVQSWGFNRDSNGNVNGTATVNYTGRDLTATTTIEAATDKDASGTDTVCAVAVTYQPNIYIVGDYLDGNNWGFTNGTLMDYANGEYSKTITIANSGSCIMFARTTGVNYNWDDNRLFFGAKSGSDWVYGTDNSNNLVMYGSGYNNQYYPIKFNEPGDYKITINAAAKTFTVTKALPQVATPVFSPENCSFVQPQSVSITCATDGATIYYTTDGSTPTTSSTQYSGPLTVNETTTVKAIAVKNDMDDSEVAEATYTKTVVIAGTVTPTTLTMNTQAGTPVTATVTIENTGNTVFTPTQSLTGDNVFTATAAGQVAVDGTQTITVTYHPTTVGTHTATLVININGNVTAVNITGVAVQSGEPTESTLAALASDELYLPDRKGPEAVTINGPLIGIYFIEKTTTLIARDTEQADHKWYQDENDEFFTSLKNSGYDYNIYQYSRLFKQNNWVALHFDDDLTARDYVGKIITSVTGILNVTKSFDIDLDVTSITVDANSEVSEADMKINTFNCGYFDLHDQGRIYNDNLRNEDPYFLILPKPNEVVNLNWAILREEGGKYYFYLHERATVENETTGEPYVMNQFDLKGEVEVRFDLYPAELDPIEHIVSGSVNGEPVTPFVLAGETLSDCWLHDNVVGLVKTEAKTVRSPQWGPRRINTTPDEYFGVESKDWDINYVFYPIETREPSDNYDPGTSVKTVNVDRIVISKVYYNIAGQSSSKPFSGINIVKTNYSDGSSIVTKQYIK